MQIRFFTGSVISNVMATHYTHSLNGIFCPHWPVQWSYHCSCMCIPVHSPWLPGYKDVVQTVLIILMLVGHVLERPHRYFHPYRFTICWVPVFLLINPMVLLRLHNCLDANTNSQANILVWTCSSFMLLRSKVNNFVPSLLDTSIFTLKENMEEIVSRLYQYRVLQSIIYKYCLGKMSCSLCYK